MENDPKEIELNFDGSNSSSAPENNGQWSSMEAANDMFSDAAAAEENPVAEVTEKSQAVMEEVVAPVAAAVENTAADIFSSRQPMNRPAGTPPLENAPQHEKVSAVELVVAGKSYGQALRILREHYQVTHKELEQATLIQTHYLEALENENLSALPPLVYVIAFTRSLCNYYKVSSETSTQLVAKLKEQLEYTCNDELMNSLDVDASGAEVNEKRMKRIIFGFAGALVFLVVVIVGILIFARSGEPDVTVVETPVGKQHHFDPNTIYPLLEPPALDLPKLPVAE